MLFKPVILQCILENSTCILLSCYGSLREQLLVFTNIIQYVMIIGVSIDNSFTWLHSHTNSASTLKFLYTWWNFRSFMSQKPTILRAKGTVTTSGRNWFLECQGQNTAEILPLYTACITNVHASTINYRKRDILNSISYPLLCNLKVDEGSLLHCLSISIILMHWSL